IVSRIGVSQYQPGKTIRVRFDPSDHTSIAVESPEAAPIVGGVSAADLARTQGADVVVLTAHYDAPQIPSTLRGLKVQMIYTLVGGPASGQSDDLRMQGCREAGLNLFDRIGWWLVHDPSEAHDIVVRGECSTSANFLTTD